jgi:hypothetical protein
VVRGEQAAEDRLAAAQQREGLVAAALAVPPEGEADEGLDDVDVFEAEGGLADRQGAVEVDASRRAKSPRRVARRPRLSWL